MQPKIFTLALVLFMIGSTSYGQTCLPGGIVFDLQSEIDNFQTDYPNCTEIGATVYITGQLITNLNGLSTLVSIENSLHITNCPNLNSLSGLDNLESVGGVLEIGGTKVVNLSALGKLADVAGGDITIRNNPNMTNIAGLSGIDSLAGNLEIKDNDALVSINGFAGLVHIAGNLTVEKTWFWATFQG